MRSVPKTSRGKRPPRKIGRSFLHGAVRYDLVEGTRALLGLGPARQDSSIRPRPPRRSPKASSWRRPFDDGILTGSPRARWRGQGGADERRRCHDPGV